MLSSVLNSERAVHMNMAIYAHFHAHVELIAAKKDIAHVSKNSNAATIASPRPTSKRYEPNAVMHAGAAGQNAAVLMSGFDCAEAATAGGGYCHEAQASALPLFPWFLSSAEADSLVAAVAKRLLARCATTE